MTGFIRARIPAALSVAITLSVTGCAGRSGARAGDGQPSTAGAAVATSTAIPTGTPATPPTTSSTIPPTAWVSGMPPGQSALLLAADHIRPMLRDTYADWFASIALQQPVRPNDKTEYALLVYRIPHRALDDAVRRALPDVKVVFIGTKLNTKQQQALTNSISFGYWRDRGLRINTVGCDFNGVCTFGVDDPDKWRAALEAEYGKGNVVVTQQGPPAPLTGDVPPGATLASGPR